MIFHISDGTANDIEALLKSENTLVTQYCTVHFDQYTFGRPVVVETDHRPLKTVSPKPLNQMPKRLQSIFMDMGYS